MPAHPLKLLVVDDDDIDREHIYRLLSNIDIEIDECTNADKSIELIKKDRYDCILLDYRLGKDDGLTVLNIIRRDLLKNIAVIIMTGLGDEQVAAQALRLGASDYLTKDGLKSQILIKAILDAVHNADLTEQLNKLAHYDALTGLVSRHLLIDRIQQVIELRARNEKPAALAFIDLDNFKPVNDQFGHSAGDTVLIEVAKRLSKGLRSTDTVARIGGDEFVILLSEVEDAKACEQLLHRTLMIVNIPIEIETGNTVRITASIGVRLIFDSTQNADTVLRNADQTMYQAKINGKSQIFFFDELEEARKVKRRQLINSIEAGLNNNEFELYYQPKVNIETGELSGFEALIRWHHPKHGDIMPSEFHEALNQGGICIAIGQWVIEQTIQQWLVWNKQNHCFSISVNISPTHLLSMDFVEYITYLLNEYPEFNPNLLELEIIESSSIQNFDKALKVLHAIKNLGIKVSLDDFGTGYASLTYFRKLPLDTIKIDKSFILKFNTNTLDFAIVNCVIQLAKSFQYQVVAEGVETLDQLKALRALGCHTAQGYYFSKPIPCNEVLSNTLGLNYQSGR